MKVCTDACLFGAWTVDEFQKSKVKSKNVLDIGSGTGLLSLMLAQKLDAHIDAVEIDEMATEQAKENVGASPWSNKIEVHQSAIQDFVASNKYNVIISNPPFYEASLKSDDVRKNLAKHTGGLSFEELASIASSLLEDDGVFYILLPYSSFDSFKAIAAKQQLFLKSLVNVKQTGAHNFFRSMAVFCKTVQPNVEMTTLDIKASDDDYSAEFKFLLKDYYLAL